MYSGVKNPSNFLEKQNVTLSWLLDYNGKKGEVDITQRIRNDHTFFFSFLTQNFEFPAKGWNSKTREQTS